MILVVTHNGLPPSQGGKRIGYQIDNTFIHIATGGVYSVSALLAPFRAAAVKLPIFSNLPYCNGYGDCNNCGQNDNAAESIQTDEGEKAVVTCKSCGRKMRFRALSSLF